MKSASNRATSLLTQATALGFLNPAFGMGAKAALVRPDEAAIGHSEVLLAPEDMEFAADHSSYAVQANASAGVGLASITIPAPVYVNWTDRLERRFDALANKKVFGKLNDEEAAEFERLTISRRKSLPSRSAEEIMRSAEHDRLIKEMDEIVERYVEFSSRRAHHESYVPSRNT